MMIGTAGVVVAGTAPTGDLTTTPTADGTTNVTSDLVTTNVTNVTNPITGGSTNADERDDFNPSNIRRRAENRCRRDGARSIRESQLADERVLPRSRSV